MAKRINPNDLIGFLQTIAEPFDVFTISMAYKEIHGDRLELVPLSVQLETLAKNGTLVIARVDETYISYCFNR